MSEVKVFNRLDLNKVPEMYDPSHQGAIHIKGAINGEFLALLRSEISTQIEKYGKAGVSVTCNNVLKGTNPNSAFYRLMDAYTVCVYNSLAERMKFAIVSNAHDLSTEFIRYNFINKTAAHQDSTYEINLIGIVTISGKAKFIIEDLATKQEATKIAESFLVIPGDMVLMRANMPLKDSKIDLRPWHCVDILEHRECLVIRKEYRALESRCASILSVFRPQ